MLSKLLARPPGPQDAEPAWNVQDPGGVQLPFSQVAMLSALIALGHIHGSYCH